MKIRNEYLVIIDKESSKGFYSICEDTNRFNEYIGKNSNIKINKNAINFNRKRYDYSIKKGNVKGKKQIFFYISIASNDDEKNINEYKKLLRELKSALHGDNFIVETLKDELSFYYAHQAYALVHSIENLMRKFITYFMITNVGKNWVEETSPDQIKNALDKSKRKQYIDVLQQLDFIHLGDFLFKSYQEEDISNLFEKIKSLDDATKIDIENLKNYIPKSNWDKYFKDSLDCDDSYLKIRWEKIYALRNKIAHTSHFTEGDYKEITLLVNEVKDKLDSAFENIDAIELHQKDKDSITENIAVNVDENLGKFIMEWNKLESNLRTLSDAPHTTNPLKLISELKEKEIIDDEFLNKINELRIIRNKLIHNIDSELTERKNLPMYNKMIAELNNDFHISWKSEIVHAIRDIGGEVTLDQIYDYIESKTHRVMSPSWKSSVRKTIYLHSSDTKIFNGNEDLFKKVGRGKWSLK